MNAWVPKNLVRADEAFSLAATEEWTSDSIPASAVTARQCVVAVKVANVAGTVTAYLETFVGNETAVVAKQAALSNGMNYIYFFVGQDSITNPLLPNVQVRIGAAAASSVDVERVWLIKED